MSITINLNNVQPLDELLTALSDLSFSGNESLYLRVNSTADAFEFAAASGGGGGVWGSITGTLSSQTDLQNALNAKANLTGAAFTGAVSVTTSGSGTTLDLTNSGSGTTLNIANSGSGSLLVVDSTKFVVTNAGNTGIGTASPSARQHIVTGGVSTIGQIIQAAAGQTANLQQWRNSAGTVGSLLLSTGQIHSKPYAAVITNFGAGEFSLENITSGARNTAIGRESMRGAASITGNDNVGIGHQSLSNITTGLRNTALGAESGVVLRTGSDNTYVGYAAFASSLSVSNELVLGGGVGGNANTGLGANTIKIGNASHTDTYLSGTVRMQASTTTRAGLRILSGVDPSSPVAGDLWFDGTNLKFYDGTTTHNIV